MILRAVLLVEFAFLLMWSSGFVGAKYGLAGAGTFTLLFWRYLLLSAVLFLWLAVRGDLRFDRAQLRRAAGMGVLGHAVWLVAVIKATEYGVSPGIVALIAALQPLMTGVVAGPVLHECVTRAQWVGLLLGFVGVALVVGDQIHIGEAQWWAYLLPLVSAIALTWATVWQRSLEIQSTGFLPVLKNLAVQCWASTAVLFPFALGIEHLRTEWNADFIFALGWLTFVVSLAAYGMLIFLFKHRRAPHVAALLYLTPPVAMLMDYFAFGAAITITGIIGMIVAATGVVLSRR